MSQSKEGKVFDGRGLVGSKAGRTGDADAERGMVVLFMLFELLLVRVLVGYPVEVNAVEYDTVG